jgi:hypothetical protein
MCGKYSFEKIKEMAVSGLPFPDFEVIGEVKSLTARIVFKESDVNPM